MSARAARSLCVKDIMGRNPVRVGQATTVGELAEILEGNDISGVPVVDAQERLVGVVSRTDLIRRCVEGPPGTQPGSFFSALAEGLGGGTDLDPEELGVVEDFMSLDPVTAEPDEPVGRVAFRMVEEQVHRAIVVDEQRRVIGVVTALDLLKVFPS